MFLSKWEKCTFDESGNFFLKVGISSKISLQIIAANSFSFGRGAHRDGLISPKWLLMNVKVT